MRYLFKTLLWIFVFAIGGTSITAYVIADTFFIQHPIEDNAIITRDPLLTRRPTTTVGETTAVGSPSDTDETTAAGGSSSADDSTNQNQAPITTDGISIPTAGETTYAGSPSTGSGDEVTVTPDTGSPQPSTGGTDIPVTTPVTPETDAPVTTAAVTTAPITTTPVTTVAYPIIGDMYYKDENIEISIEKQTVKNQNNASTNVYVVDLKLSDIEYLQTAFATDRSGNIGYNITDTVSDIAEGNNAIFAINGDFCYFKEGKDRSKFVIRNYDGYMNVTTKDREDVGLIVNWDGSLEMVDGEDVTLAELMEACVYQYFYFGPRLVENNSIMVKTTDEVDQSASSNQRCAIGMIEPLHYKIVVSEGRLIPNDGLSLYELAVFMKRLGCTVAYNLDGGTSATLWFNGEVLNTLSDDERNVSDIIFVNGKKYYE